MTHSLNIQEKQVFSGAKIRKYLFE